MDVYGNDLDIPADVRQAFLRERTGALVGEAMARKWGWKVGDRVPIASNIFSQRNGARTWDMTIVGIMKAKTPQMDTNFMAFQYGYFDETRSFGKDTIGWMVLRTGSPAVNDRVSKAIDQMFLNSSDETSTDTEKAFNKAFVAQIGGPLQPAARHVALRSFLQLPKARFHIGAVQRAGRVIPQAVGQRLFVKLARPVDVRKPP